MRWTFSSKVSWCIYHNTTTGKLTELNSGIKSYLLGIVRLKALETNRSNQKSIYPEDLQSTLADVEDAPPGEESGLTDVIKTLLAQLGNSCRQLLHMYYSKDMNLNEIMGNTEYASVDSIKTQKYKWMKRLQEILLDHNKARIIMDPVNTLDLRQRNDTFFLRTGKYADYST